MSTESGELKRVPSWEEKIQSAPNTQLVLSLYLAARESRAFGGGVADLQRAVAKRLLQLDDVTKASNFIVLADWQDLTDVQEVNTRRMEAIPDRGHDRLNASVDRMSGRLDDKLGELGRLAEYFGIRVGSFREGITEFDKTIAGRFDINLHQFSNTVRQFGEIVENFQRAANRINFR